jgi:hypothetical protein
MVDRLFRRLLAALVVSAFLLGGQGSVHGYVLCFGENGHAAFEQAAWNGCGDQPPVAAGELHPALSGPDEHCGPCLDLPAFQETLQARSRAGSHVPVQSPASVFVQTPAVPVCARDLTASLIPQPPPRPDGTLLALRSVVLRH